MKARLHGFTLVEILVVIVLIVALIIFSLINIPAQVAKARDAERKNSIDMIGKFIEEYYFDSGCYPISIPTCGNPLYLGDKIYLSNLPCDPKSKDSYVYVSEIGSCPKWFQLYGNLENKQDTAISTLGCENGCGPKCQFNYGKASSNVRLNPFCEETIPSPSGNSASTSESTAQVGVEIQKLQYVCTPGGECEAFVHPEISGCPDIYLDDSTCQNQCIFPKNRCHDSRGKTN